MDSLRDQASLNSMGLNYISNFFCNIEYRDELIRLSEQLHDMINNINTSYDDLLIVNQRANILAEAREQARLNYIIHIINNNIAD